jgi:phospholipase C
MAAIDGIKHVIVLMLENRSFDCMLGKLKPVSPQFAGLPDDASNPYLDAPRKVWSSGSWNGGTATIPDPDPGESFADMNQQIFGAVPRDRTRPSMAGFVANYASQAAGGQPLDPVSVMHYFTREQLPVLTALADCFGVCDQWHASAPCQTWPNRFFAHTGTCQGYVNNDQFPVPFGAPSIFGRLSAAALPWRVYFHDVPQSIMLADVLLRAADHYKLFGQFLADAHAGALPAYSFIEPRYFADLNHGIPNDQHPPHDVTAGEKLLADVYNAVRNSPCWMQSLLIITYDEHGGCFDHMPPPLAVPPDGNRHPPDNFAFDTYGVRVPAVIVSPYMPKGSIVRSAPAGTAFDAPPYPFDHTSIIATLRRLFPALGGPLTRRDAVAPDLIASLSLPGPTNDSLPSITYSPPGVSSDAVRAAAYAAPNGHQDVLARMAQLFGPTATVPVQQALPGAAHKSVITAGMDAAARIKSFLGL